MAVVRYFRPGVNWVGRVLFLVPVLGVALVAMSGGQWGYSDGWVTIGLGVWVAVAFVAEGVLWPAERRLQEVVATRESAGGTAAGTGSDGAGGDGAARGPDRPRRGVPAIGPAGDRHGRRAGGGGGADGGQALTTARRRRRRGRWPTFRGEGRAVTRGAGPG